MITAANSPIVNGGLIVAVRSVLRLPDKPAADQSTRQDVVADTAYTPLCMYV